MYYDRRPDVKIAESIYRTRSDHRVRTTAGHEFGHVWLHAPLWREAGARMGATAGPVWNCYRDNIINAPENDWTEWQAGMGQRGNSDAGERTSHLVCGIRP
jgi:hypothetical protein